MDYSNVLHNFPYPNLYPTANPTASRQLLVSTSNNSPFLLRPNLYPSSQGGLALSPVQQQHYFSLVERESMKRLQAATNSANQPPHPSILPVPSTHRLPYPLPGTGSSRLYVAAPPVPSEDNHKSQASSAEPPPQPPDDELNHKNSQERIGKFQYTMLEGEEIACFSLGGEQRLCLPQVLHLLPAHLNINQVSEMLEELSIICTRCKPAQLQLLKEKGVLPSKVTSCGLITKSDAERLCKHLQCLPDLLDKRETLSQSTPAPSTTFTVVHYCFGKQVGKFHSDLYVHEDAKAVECSNCSLLFTPQEFVGHSHKDSERNTCHWGFDSANWRHYLTLSEDHQQMSTNNNSPTTTTEDCSSSSHEQVKQQFDRVKYRFATTKPSSASSVESLPVCPSSSQQAMSETSRTVPETMRNESNAKRHLPPSSTSFMHSQMSSVPPRKRIRMELSEQDYNSHSQNESPSDTAERMATPVSVASLETPEKMLSCAQTPNLATSNGGALSNDEYSPISDNGIEEHHHNNTAKMASTLMNILPTFTLDADNLYSLPSLETALRTYNARETNFIDMVMQNRELSQRQKERIIEEFSRVRQAYNEQFQILNAERLRLRRKLDMLEQEERSSATDSGSDSGSLVYLQTITQLKEDIAMLKRHAESNSETGMDQFKSKYMELKERLELITNTREYKLAHAHHEHTVPSSSGTSNATSVSKSRGSPNEDMQSSVSSSPSGGATPHFVTAMPTNGSSSVMMAEATSSTPSGSNNNKSPAVPNVKEDSNQSTNDTESAPIVVRGDEEESYYLGPPDLECEGSLE